MGFTLVSPDGKTVAVDTEQQAASLLTQHYKLATPDDQLAAGEAEHQASLGHGGVAGSVNAAAGSALSGLTVGLSDKAFKGLVGKGTYDSYAQDRADNPGISTAGNIVGALLPTIATGGAAAPEEGAALGATLAELSPAGITSRIGAKVAGLGADSGLAGRILAHAGAGAAEGSIYGAGGYIGDAALGDRDLSADGFLGAMGRGAMWGGAAAGALSTGAEGLMAARRMFPRAAMTEEAVAAAGAEARDSIGYALNDADVLDAAAGRRLAQMRSLRSAADMDFAARMEQAEREATYGLSPETPRGPRFGHLLEDDPSVASIPTGADLPARTRRAIDLQLGDEPAAAAPAPEVPPVRTGTFEDLKAAASPVSDTVSETPSDLEAQLRGTQGRLNAGEDLATVGARPVPAARAAAKIGELERAFPGSFAGEGAAASRRVRTAFADSVVDDPAAHFAEHAPAEAKLAMRFAGPGETPPWEAGADLESHLNARAAEVDPDIAKLQRVREQLRQSKYQMMLWAKKIHPPTSAPEVLAGGAHAPWNAPGPWWDHIDPAALGAGKRAAPSIGESVIAAEHAPDAAQAVEEAIGRKTGDINEDVSEAAKVITQHEAAAAEATEALGMEAPPSAQAHAQAFREAQRAAEQGATQQTAELADGLERWSGHIQAAETQGADAYAGRQIEGGTTLGGELPAKAGAKRGGLLGKVADVAEVLRMMGVPLPNPAMIPVIGPLLGAYLKARVLAKAFGRFGGKVAQTAETTIASKAAQTLTRAHAAVDSLVSGATMTLDRASRDIGAPAAVLAHRLFDAGPDSKRAKDPKGTSLEDSYHARMDELSAALTPGAIERSVRQRVRANDPAIMTSLIAAMQRQLGFLWEKAPKPDAPPALLDSGPRWMPGRCELAAWSRYVDACHDPAAVLERAAAGRGVSIEEAETLRKVYPSLYLAAQTRFVEQRTSPKNSNKAIPFRRKMTMGHLFDLPVDESLQPETAAYLQQSYQAPAPPPQPGGMMGQPTIAAPVMLGQRTANRLDG